MVLTKANVDLTITSDKEREIKSPDLSAVAVTGTNVDPNAKVFLIVGAANETTLVTSIKVTLKNVGVIGNKIPTNDSLIRVRNGANLILENKSTVADHVNSAGVGLTGNNQTSDGRQGNGSAICVVNGAVLTIRSGANVTENESTGGQDNKNLVGGIYVNMAEKTTNKPKLVIEGGYIGKNKCTDGNTSDIYVTEDSELSMKGNATIGELCLNAATGKNPNFTIEGKIENEISKLNLRATKDTVSDVEGFWAPATGTKPSIFKGTTTYTIDQADVDQFKLWEFTGQKNLRGTSATADETTWANLITKKYKIVINGNAATLGPKS